MTTTVLPQLQQVEAELAEQEAAVSAQLKEVQAKLNGVRAVLPMFGEQSEGETTITPLVSEDEEQVSSATSTEELTVEEKPQQTKAKRKTSKGKKKKKDGRAADWQKYTRPGVKNQSIPDAVKLVLATQPDKEFKIAEVMEALFKDGMPRSQYLKARNRVSNVLSGGVRAGDWHRGDRSTYRMNAV